MAEKDLGKKLQRTIQDDIDRKARQAVAQEEAAQANHGLEAKICTNVERLYKHLSRIACHNGPRHLGRWLLRSPLLLDTEVAIDHSQDSMLKVRSPLFGREQGFVDGTSVHYGWQFRFAYHKESRWEQGHMYPRIYPYTSARFARVIATTSPSKHTASETWYRIDTDEIDGRVVRSEKAANDTDLQTILDVSKAAGYPREHRLMDEYMDTQWEHDGNELYAAPFPRVEWYVPTASPKAIEHCYALSQMALQEFHLR